MCPKDTEFNESDDGSHCKTARDGPMPKTKNPKPAILMRRLVKNLNNIDVGILSIFVILYIILCFILLTQV